MATTQAYSTLVHCIHDEPAPVGALGHGTHYSIFRTWERLDVELRPSKFMQLHDFAVIWDVDHDVRVMRIIEALIAHDLFCPVQFIGEHRGTLTIIIAARAWGQMDMDIDEYYDRVKSVVVHAMPDDPWLCEFGMFDRHVGSIQNEYRQLIDASDDVVAAYLKTIDAQWKLGSRSWQPGFGFDPGTWTNMVWGGSVQIDHAKRPAGAQR